MKSLKDIYHHSSINPDDEWSMICVGLGQFVDNVIFNTISNSKRINIITGIDPKQERAQAFKVFQKSGIPVFDSLDSFYIANRDKISNLERKCFPYIAINQKENVLQAFKSIQLGIPAIIEKPPGDLESLYTLEAESKRLSPSNYSLPFSI